MKSNLHTRRDFLKLTGLSVLGVAALGQVALKPNAIAQAAGPMLAETDPMAMSLGYVADANKVDTKKWPKRAGADGKTQFCSNCVLFNNGKPTKDKTSTCPLFAGKQVAAAGWCNSWAKNAAVK